MIAATDPFDGLRLRTLGRRDAERGAVLSAAVGWNQNRADWAYMLANGAGFGCTDRDGALIASAMSLPYGGFAWVCMVLVRSDYRRRGLATALTRRVIDGLQAQGVVAGLDATPAGREVYLRLGFRDIYGLRRLWAERVAPPDGAGDPRLRIAPMTEDDLDRVAAYDARAFGGDRAALLADLLARRPDRAFVARTGSGLVGYAMAREGREATQIGPVVAEETAVAVAVARRALAGFEGRAVIDAMDYQTPFAAWLESAGFAFQRPYTRMLLGRAAPFDRKERMFAPAGPELG